MAHGPRITRFFRNRSNKLPLAGAAMTTWGRYTIRVYSTLAKCIGIINVLKQEAVSVTLKRTRFGSTRGKLRNRSILQTYDSAIPCQDQVRGSRFHMSQLSLEGLPFLGFDGEYYCCIGHKHMAPLCFRSSLSDPTAGNNDERLILRGDAMFRSTETSSTYIRYYCRNIRVGSHPSHPVIPVKNVRTPKLVQS
jgi:hypothetical protein